MRNSIEYTIFDGVTPQTITSSTDATPIVVTKASHGYATGDVVAIFGHTTNIAANGIRRITVLNSSTFSLQDPYSGVDVAGSGAGAGAAGVMLKMGALPLVQDYRHAELQVTSAGTSTWTFKLMGSLGKLRADASVHTDCPNFGGTQGKTNPWGYIQLVDLADGSTVDGATGIATTGTDISKVYEVNTNGLKWLALLPTAWTQGSITAKLKLFNDI